MLKLTEHEKDEIKAYLSGEKKSHTVAVGEVQERNQVAQAANNDTGNTVTYSQSEINNLKAYIGNPEPIQSQSQNRFIGFDPKLVDAYIVSLKEMMDRNVPPPQPLTPAFKEALTKTLDSKNQFAIDTKYNITSAKEVKNQQKSSHSIGMGLPKRGKSADMSHS